MIESSGLKLRDRYSKFDAEKRFNLKDHQTQESSDCISGLILQGIKKPTQCEAFGKKCTPENPLGAPMVSSEGACAAYYRYRQLVIS
jgi:hydrogenase expression/formation protein HypD